MAWIDSLHYRQGGVSTEHERRVFKVPAATATGDDHFLPAWFQRHETIGQQFAQFVFFDRTQQNNRRMTR